MELSSPVRRAAVLLVTEAAGLLALSVAYVVGGLSGDALSRTGALLGAVMFAIGAAVLLAVARAVDGVRRWARSPAIVAQLLALPVGAGLAQAQVWLAAVPIVLLAGAVLYQFATPEARVAFRG